MAFFSRFSSLRPSFSRPFPSSTCPPVSVPSPLAYVTRLPEFNKDADLHHWRFHFDILCGDLFDDEMEAWTPTVSPMIGQPDVVGLVEDRPVVWHSCAEWKCDLCSLTFNDETELKQHTTINRNRNEHSRQWKWRHLCGLYGVTTTSFLETLEVVFVRRNTHE